MTLTASNLYLVQHRSGRVNIYTFSIVFENITRSLFLIDLVVDDRMGRLFVNTRSEVKPDLC
jgi:hypothetical protein